MNELLYSICLLWYTIFIFGSEKSVFLSKNTKFLICINAERVLLFWSSSKTSVQRKLTHRDLTAETHATFRTEREKKIEQRATFLKHGWLCAVYVHFNPCVHVLCTGNNNENDSIFYFQSVVCIYFSSDHQMWYHVYFSLIIKWFVWSLVSLDFFLQKQDAYYLLHDFRL